MADNSSYSDKLKDPRWQRKRLEIMSRDKFACTLCGDTTITLHVHHHMYVGDPWECPNQFLTTICEECHAIHHASWLTYMLKQFGATIIKVVKIVDASETRWLYTYISTNDILCLYIFEGIVGMQLKISSATVSILHNSKPE